MKESLTDQLSVDVEFLSANNIIDYSLLIGLHVLDQEPKNEIPFAKRKMNSITKKEANMLRTAYKADDSSSEKEVRKQLKKTNTYNETAKIALNEDEAVNMSEFSNFEIDLNISEGEKKTVYYINFSSKMVVLEVTQIKKYIIWVL
jgi:hypothetical protein